MLKDIENYQPEIVEYDVVCDKFPSELKLDTSDKDEAIELMEEYFVMEYPDGELATRKLDAYEKMQIRDEYCTKAERELLACQVGLSQARDSAKRMIKEAEDKLNSLLCEIRDLASMVNIGTQSVELPNGGTIRIAVDNTYLYYVWDNDRFILAKKESIPTWEKNTIFGQEKQNKEAMMKFKWLK